MAGVISDPDFDSFDGIYVGTKDDFELPKNEIDYNALAVLLKRTGKDYTELTKEELDSVKIKNRP